MSTWINEPAETPKRAPVATYAISTNRFAMTTKKIIPVAFARTLSSPYPTYEIAYPAINIIKVH